MSENKPITIQDFNEYSEKPVSIPILDELYQIPKGILSLVVSTGDAEENWFLMWNALRWTEKYYVAYLTMDRPSIVLRYGLKRLKLREQKSNHKPITFESLASENYDNWYDAVDFLIEGGCEVIIVDHPIEALMNHSEMSKTMYKLQKLCFTKNVNIFLSHYLRTKENIKDKYEMLELIEDFHQARYVWFLRRSKKTKVEVWNVKNSCLPNENDFIFGTQNNTLTKLS